VPIARNPIANLFQKARLADSRLSRQKHDLAVTLLRLPPAPQKQGNLLLAVDKGGRPQAHGRGEPRLDAGMPNHVPGLHLLGYSLELVSAEVLVLDGNFDESGERFEPQSWLRLPAGGTLEAKAGPGGCKVWVKTGHLLRIEGANRP